VVRLLLREEADIEASDSNGQTALLVAACQGDAAIVRLLLKEYVDQEATDDDGKTALILAKSGGHHTVAQMFDDDDDGDDELLGSGDEYSPAPSYKTYDNKPHINKS